MKCLIVVSTLLLCLGCSSETGPVGLEQDEISRYVAENPDIDAKRSIGTEDPEKTGKKK